MRFISSAKVKKEIADNGILTVVRDKWCRHTCLFLESTDLEVEARIANIRRKGSDRKAAETHQTIATVNCHLTAAIAERRIKRKRLKRSTKRQFIIIITPKATKKRRNQLKRIPEKSTGKNTTETETVS